MHMDINTDLNKYIYKSFISYSHSDEKWAKWLHKALEHYHVPAHLVGKTNDVGIIPKRLNPVFRDRDELASATDLSTIINESLEKSATQIVICSPKAAQSQWVNEEILTFKRLGRSHRIFCVIVSGEPYASTMPGREDEECFPEALRFQLGEDGNISDVPAEPIAADVRPGKDGKTNAKIKLLAGILGVGFDDLRQREQQRRNRRMMFISVASFVGMVFAIGLATTAIIARNEAQEQREIAEAEAETARQTSTFMVDLFAVSDPSEARGNTITAREILDKGAQRIDSELAGQPKIQATLMDTIGSVYTSLGLYNQAKSLLMSSLEKRQSAADVTDTDVAKSLYNLAQLLTEQADLKQAEIHYQEAIKILEKSGEDDKLLVNNYAGLAELYFRMSKYKNAEGLLINVLDAQRTMFGENSLETAEAVEELGLNYFDQGNYAESEKLLRQSLAVRKIIFGEIPHPDWADNLNNLGSLLNDKGDFEQADILYNQALDMYKILFGDSHPEVAGIYNNLAYLNHDRKKYEVAEKMYRKAISILKKVHGDAHPEIAITMNNLSYLLHDKGQTEAAIDMVDLALQMAVKSLGGRHHNVAGYSATKARWLAEAGEYEQSVLILKEALSIREELLDKNHPRLIMTRLDLVVSLIGNGNIDEALKYAQETYNSQSDRKSEQWLKHAAESGYGSVLSKQGHFSKAESLLIKGYEGMHKDEAVRPILISKSLERLIDMYNRWNKPEKAELYKAKLDSFLKT